MPIFKAISTHHTSRLKLDIKRTLGRFKAANSSIQPNTMLGGIKCYKIIKAQYIIIHHHSEHCVYVSWTPAGRTVGNSYFKNLNRPMCS